MTTVREEYITTDAYREFVKDLIYYNGRIQTIEYVVENNVWVVISKSWTSQIRTTHIYHLD